MCPLGPGVGRMQRILERVSIALVVVAASTASPCLAADETASWDNTQGNWSDASRWSTASFPDNGNGGLTYDAVVAGGQVTLDQAITIDALTFSNGAINGNNDLSLSTLNWSSGNFNGTGIIAASSGTLDGGSKLLNQTLELNGAVDWLAGTITFTSSLGTVHALAGTNFVDSGLANKTLTANVTIDSGATFRRDGANRTTHGLFGASLINNGAVEVNNGVLSFSGQGTGSGSFDVAGGQLEFTSGNHAYSGSIAGSGNGVVRFSGGVVDLTGSYTANTVVNSGTVSFNTAADAHLNTLELTGGVVGGNATMTIPMLTWNGGRFAASSAADVTNATLGSSTKLLDGTLRLSDTADWSAGTITFSTATGTLELLSGASMTDNGDSTKSLSADLIIHSGATYHRNAGNGRTTQGQFSTSLTNNGTLQVDAGVMALVGTGSGNGDFIVNGGELSFDGGTHAYSGSVTASPSGLIEFGGASVDLDGDYLASQTSVRSGTVNFNGTSVDLGVLTLSGGTIGGASDFTVPELQWTGGRFDGPGTITVLSGDFGAGAKFLQRHMRLDGDLEWADGIITFSTSAGTLEVLPSATLSDTGDATKSLTAHLIIAAGGTYHRATGSGRTTQGQFSTTLVNEGTIRVDAGTLDFTGNGSGDGDFVVQNGELDFSGGTHAYSGSITGAANSTVRFSGGTVDVTGAFDVSNMFVTSGSVNFDSGAIPAVGMMEVSTGTVAGSDVLSIDNLNWTGGNFAGSGDVVVRDGTFSGGAKFLQRNMLIDGNVDWQNGIITFSTAPGTIHVRTGANLTDSGDSTKSLFADVNLMGGSTFAKIGNATTTHGQFGTSLTNEGLIRVTGGELSLVGGFTNFDSGTSTLTGGAYEVATTLTFQGANITTNRADITLVGPASQIRDQFSNDALVDLALNDSLAALRLRGGRDFSTSSALVNRGTIELADAATLSAADLVNEATGTLLGSGTFAPLSGVTTNEGSVSPGNSVGTLVVEGDYVQTATGTLWIELGGTMPGQSDLLDVVGGAASLDGALQVTLDSGFVPQANESITVLTASGGRNGVFASVGLPSVPNIAFETRYDPNAVVLDTFHSVDFDRDGIVDAVDIDALVMEVVSGTNDALYDLTGNGVVDGDDLQQWLVVAGSINLPSQGAYLVGDANLDGLVDGQDFLIWNTNKFSSTGTWTLGDFTADGLTDGQDFLLWNLNKFMTSDSTVAMAHAVPESVLGVWTVLLFLGCQMSLRKVTTRI